MVSILDYARGSMVSKPARVSGSVKISCQKGRCIWACLNASEKLCQDHKIQDDRSRQQAVLTGVVKRNSVATSHEDLARVLIHGALAVRHIRHVFDHYHMVRMLSRPVKDGVGVHHVIYLQWEICEY